MRTRHFGLLIVAILLISTAPLYAQRQQQNVAKLKADARNTVGIIGGDKAKTQTFCQILDLGRTSSPSDGAQKVVTHVLVERHEATARAMEAQGPQRFG
jgi:hypothetical protein